MPSAVSLWVGFFSRSTPLRRMLPLEGLSRPITLFISVVLPAPLRPSRPVIEPAGTSSDTPRRICMAAIETFRFWMLSTLARHVALHFGIGERLGRRRVDDDAAVVEGEHPLREAADDL